MRLRVDDGRLVDQGDRTTDDLHGVHSCFVEIAHVSYLGVRPRRSSWLKKTHSVTDSYTFQVA